MAEADDNVNVPAAGPIYRIVPDRIPINEVISQLRKFNGKTDVGEFFRRFETDLEEINVNAKWKLYNLDRVLEEDAKAYWTAQFPKYETRFRQLGAAPEEELNAIWEDIKDEFESFFSQSSQKIHYKQKNRQLEFKLGQNPQEYVSNKLEILRHIDPSMSEERQVENLMKGLPYELKQNMAMLDIHHIRHFLSKLCKVNEVFEEKSFKDKKSSPETGTRSRSPMSEAALAQVRQDNRPKGRANYSPDGIVICDYCYKKGHYQRDCRSRARDQGQQPPSFPFPNQNYQQGNQNPYQPHPNQNFDYQYQNYPPRNPNYQPRPQTYQQRFPTPYQNPNATPYVSANQIYTVPYPIPNQINVPDNVPNSFQNQTPNLQQGN